MGRSQPLQSPYVDQAITRFDRWSMSDIGCYANNRIVSGLPTTLPQLRCVPVSSCDKRALASLVSLAACGPPSANFELLRLRNRAEALERSLASPQLSQLLFADLLGAACHCPHSLLDKYPMELRIRRRGRDVPEGPQQP